MTSDWLLEVHDLTLRYGEVEALSSVSFTVRRGRATGIVGESGSGKSSIGVTILSLLPPGAHVAAGQILFDGVDLLRLPERDIRALRGNRLSFVSQNPARALTPTLTIWQHMSDVQFRSKRSVAGKRRVATEMLEKVGLPDIERCLGSYPHELSGGQRQRVSIAMAMMVKPDLLIADEPTTALDATLEVQIVELLHSLQRELGCSMIFITHNLGLLPAVCDDLVVLEAGLVRERGTVANVLAAPKHPYTRMLLQCDPARISKKTRRLPTKADDLGAPVTQHFGPPDRVQLMDPPVLAIQDLKVTYGRQSPLGRLVDPRAGSVVKAVKDVSLTVQPGETVALVGESGSGKTTVARCVLGLIDPDGGSIRIDGREITGLSTRQLGPIRRNVAMMFQDPVGSLSPRFSVGAIVTEPQIICGVAVADRRQAAIRLLELVGLDATFADRYPHELSGGEARRVGVARALCVSPKLIVADEPTAGLDLSIQGEILNLLAEIQERMQLSILLITHNLAVVRHISDRIAVMYMGDLVEQGVTEQVFAAPRHGYTRRLMAANLAPVESTIG